MSASSRPGLVAVSPHLDDAALSASVALSAGGARIATVFTALPPDGWPVSWWDRLTGAASSIQRQRERLAEDQAVMAMLSASAIHLDVPEAQYREGDPDLGVAIERLTELFSGASEVWLPSAIGGHRDHAFARDAGLRAAIAAGHREVTLYADFPYVIAYGWPAWVSGLPADTYLDAAFWLEGQLIGTGLDPERLTPVVTKLDDSQRELKTAVIGAYQTQAGALNLTSANLAANPEKLDFELAWRMRVAT